MTAFYNGYISKSQAEPCRKYAFLLPTKIQTNFYFEPPIPVMWQKLNLYVWDFLFLSLPQGIVCQFWGTYLELKCLPRTEMDISGSIFHVICVQSHVLRSILDPIESLAVGPHVLPLNFLSSSPGPGRPPHYLHDESLGLCVALPDS